MFSKGMPGSVEIICGSMFSGKTEELVRRLKRASIARQKIQIFKPEIDRRYSDSSVESHDGEGLPSQSVSTSAEILQSVDDNTRVVGIDEVQFFDSQIVEVTQKLAYRGIRVILAGLDMDFLGKPFGPMPELLASSEQVTKLSAVCMVCGGAASRTQRLRSDSSEQVLVGAGEVYEARCRFCHEPNLEQLTTSLHPLRGSEETNDHGASEAR